MYVSRHKRKIYEMSFKIGLHIAYNILRSFMIILYSGAVKSTCYCFTSFYLTLIKTVVLALTFSRISAVEEVIILPTTFTGEYGSILFGSLLIGVGPKNRQIAFPSGQYATSDKETIDLGFSSSADIVVLS